MPKKINVCIIGFGNVGYHLAKRFAELKDIKLSQLLTRSQQNTDHSFLKGVEIRHSLEEVEQDTDLIFLCVKDSQIPDLQNSLRYSKACLIHCSGSVGIEEIKSKRAGVFYPLQSFKKGYNIDYSGIPVFIEAKEEDDEDLLLKLAFDFSGNAHHLNSQKRKELHLTAVIANNFINGIFTWIEKRNEYLNLPPKALNLLIEHTFEKANEQNALNNQTGPAVREDRETINKHLKMLGSEKERQAYKALSDLIMYFKNNKNG